MSILTKSYRMQVKAVDDGQGLIEAYGSVFDYEDSGGDIVRRGAFVRTIKNSKARVADGKAKFLIPMLWQHDEKQPIGGWYDLQETDHGLLCKGQIILTTQLGKDAYELIKAGVVNEFSIGYDIPKGGANYDKASGVHNLTELRLWEISPVTFAMNDEALLVGVKSASGKTSWPLGDRNAAWDGGGAHNRIVAWATGADGELDAGKMQSVHFWYDSANSDKVTAYKLLFCDIKSGNVQAMPRGIFACAAAMQGSRGNTPDIDSEDAVKNKIAAYYKRMAKAFNDDSIKVPWDDSSKARDKDIRKKTLQEHYNEEMAGDLLEDWQDVYLCALTCAVLDAFKIGDQPQEDISQALDDFKELVLSKFVAQAQEVGLSAYLAENTYSSSPADYAMQYGSDSQPAYGGYMSSNISHDTKTGRAISATNAQAIQEHVKAVKSMADEAKKNMNALHKAMHGAANALQDRLAGNDQDEEDQNDDSKPTKPDNTDDKPEAKPGKSAVAPPAQARNAQQSRPSQLDTVNDEDAQAAALLALFKK